MAYKIKRRRFASPSEEHPAERQLSFACEVKSEICRNRLKNRRRVAQAYGLLLFGRRFSVEEMYLVTDRRSIAHTYADTVSDLVGQEGSVTIRESLRSSGLPVYRVSVDNESDRRSILEQFSREEERGIHRELLEEEGMAAAFLSGAYLACGNVTDPTKNYHLEFMVYEAEQVETLRGLLEVLIAPPLVSSRRNVPILYYRESEHIEDALTVIGASNATLRLMEVKIYKDMRNKVNRVTNCETANIDKTVNAAARQVDAIEKIFRVRGEDSLSEELRAVAHLRLENPDLSLRELSELMTGSISRSGLNHRLNKLVEIAASLPD